MPLIDAKPDTLAKTYARAIYETANAAGGRGVVEELLGELEDILELAREDARFGEFLASRILSAEKRDRALVSVFSGRASDLTVRTLRLLNRKHRLGHLPAIVAAYDEIVQEQFGRVEVDVITPARADAGALESIRERLSAALGKEVIAHAYAEPGMIGGVKLRIGDRLIDASVATKLRQLSQRMREQGAANIKARASDFLG